MINNGKILNISSWFSGIGAFEKGVSNIGVNYNVVNFCEINEYASKYYSVLHNVPEELNLVDVTKVDANKLIDKNIHLFTHGSPCQDMSSAGKQLGADENSGTRSSLLWNTVEIIKTVKPRFVIWENVKNCLSPKHKHNVDKYIDELKKVGYTSFLPEKGYLNSKDYNVPQSRDRVFIVSILNCDKEYIFPKKMPLTNTLDKYICFREKDDITNCFFNRYKNVINKDGTYEDFINYINSLKVSKGIGQKKLNMYSYAQMDSLSTCEGLSPTLTCRGVQNYCTKFWFNNRIYKPSPRMCWKLMGFTDEDFNKVKHIGNDKELWDRAGNSIVVNVIELILKELLENFDW